MRTASCKEKQDIDICYGLVYNGATDDIRRQVYGRYSIRIPNERRKISSCS